MIPNSILIAILTAVLYVLLGACATIAVAVALKSYLVEHSHKLDEIVSPPAAVRAVQNLFNFFHVPSYHRIKIGFNSTYIDHENEILIVVPENGLEFSGLIPHTEDRDCVDFSYHLPQMTKNHAVVNAKIGWRKLFEYEGHTYALTLLSLEPHETVTFDFRRVSARVKPLD